MCQRLPFLRSFFFVGVVLTITQIVAACGPKFFPDCGKPGVDCPPCTGTESYPDPCASRARDAGTESGK